MVYVMFSKVHYTVISHCIVDCVECLGWSILNLLYVTPCYSTSILCVRSLKILIRQMQQTDHELNILRPQTLSFLRLIHVLFNVREAKPTQFWYRVNLSEECRPTKKGSIPIAPMFALLFIDMLLVMGVASEFDPTRTQCHLALTIT